MNAEHIKSALLHYAPEGKLDDQYRFDIISFMTRCPADWASRATRDGHITASAWVLNAVGSHALLLHHAKLNRWLQPGGHLEPGDATVAAGALREAREESGLSGLHLVSEAIFDVDVHPIPARNEEPKHLHYDIRYLVRADSESVSLSAESRGFRWVPLADLQCDDIDESIRRLARRSPSPLMQLTRP